MSEESRIDALQHKSLRTHFYQLVEDVLGPDYYYNEAMDVYLCDEFACRDIWYEIQGMKDQIILLRFSLIFLMVAILFLVFFI